jgi:hypothetical protein
VRISLVNLCLLVLLLVHPAAAAEQQIVRLKSGKSITVLSTTRMTFADGSHPPSLLLRYQSSLPLEDSPTLRAEVLEVWELLKPHADAAHDTYAMVSANEPIVGAVSVTRRFTYGFERLEDGTWRMREPKK